LENTLKKNRNQDLILKSIKSKQLFAYYSFRIKWQFRNHNKSRQAYNNVLTNILNVEMTPQRYAKNHGRCGINPQRSIKD
jgi:hypothetical protein